MSIATQKRSTMTLFSGAQDLASHRVRLVLAEKSVKVDIEEVESTSLPEELLEINPYQSLPTLVDRDLILYEPQIIMEYLDERFPHPPLMPVYPLARANNRLMMHRMKNDWFDLYEASMSTTDLEKAKAIRLSLVRDLTELETVWKSFAFFMSEEFSLLDCSLGPLLWRLYAEGLITDQGNAKALYKYMQRLFSREAFAKALTKTEAAMAEIL